MKGKFALILLLIALSCIAISIAFPPSKSSLKKFSSCEEIKNFLNTEVEIFYARNLAAPVLKSIAESKGLSSRDYSTTNIQVAGVDEADIVKNDGKYIYVISKGKVFIVNAYPVEQAKVLAEIEFDGTPLEIFINKDKLVVFGGESSSKENSYFRTQPNSKTFIKIYDISDREKPKLIRNISIDGNYYDSRMIDDYVYAVVNKNIYDYSGEINIPRIEGTSTICECTDVYYFDVPDTSYFFSTIVAINTQNEEELESKIFLMGYAQQMYVSHDNIFIVYQKRLSPAYYYEKIIKEVLIPVSPSELVSRINEISSYNITMHSKLQEIQRLLQNYMQQLSQVERASLEEKIMGRMSKLQDEIAREMQKTVIHKISIDSGRIEYRAQGEVLGVVLNQFSMDEYENHFRIATTTWGGNLEANHIFILNGDLKIVGKLEDLAPGERIYSARFIGDRCYLVTFKKVDPLFIIDLSNPSSPRVLGKLKIPGYSNYLHPYDENHIIGIGKETVEAEEGNFAWYQGVKLSLFDVSNVSQPREIAKYTIGDRGTDSYVLRDHKAFLFNKTRNLLIIPILLAEIDEQKYSSEIPPYIQGDYIWQGAYVFELTLENGFVLKGRITHSSSEAFEKSGYYYYSPYSIKRSLYIENILYTISDKLIKANSLESLEELISIPLTPS